MLRRRNSIGLSGPETANRFMLWGTTLVGSDICNSIDAGAKLFVPRALADPLLRVTNSAVGLFAALCLTRAFWPQRRIDPDPIAEPKPGWA